MGNKFPGEVFGELLEELLGNSRRFFGGISRGTYIGTSGRTPRRASREIPRGTLRRTFRRNP